MTFEAKQKQALAILGKTGMWRSNYAPLAVRFLWRIGVKVPPPHFAPFWATAVVCSAWFAIAWGILMWFTVWSHQNMPLYAAIISALIAGAVFGLFMSVYYAYGRRKHELPSWSSLSETNNGT